MKEVRVDGGNNMELNPLTDKQTVYPSIDKPWLRYYKGEFPFIPNPNCSIYEYLHLRNENRLEYSAINYFGKKITYRELFDNIEKTVLALNALGVKKGENVKAYRFVKSVRLRCDVLDTEVTDEAEQIADEEGIAQLIRRAVYTSGYKKFRLWV